MTKILYSKGEYWVTKAKHGFEVYRSGVTHSTRCAVIGWEGERGMMRAITEIERRLKDETTNKEQTR